MLKLFITEQPQVDGKGNETEEDDIKFIKGILDFLLELQRQLETVLSRHKLIM